MNEKLAASLILLRVALLLGLSVDKGGGGGLATATAAASGSSLSENTQVQTELTPCERQERCKQKCDVLIKMYFCSFLL